MVAPVSPLFAALPPDDAVDDALSSFDDPQPTASAHMAATAIAANQRR
jgi:hypothetical protein